MPLSDHEQRLLEQIEQALYAEDPKFASSYRANDLRSHYRRRLIRCSVLFVVGLALLLAGVITKLIAMGVAGFVVMLFALIAGLSAWQRLSGRRDIRSGRGAQPQQPRPPKASVRERLEQRWQRRWDDRGQ